MLREPAPPPSLERTLNRNLGNFLQPGDPTLPDAQRAIRTGQQVFSVGLKPLSQGRKLGESANPRSWRFSIPARSGPPLFVTVTRQDGDPPQITGLSRGPQAAIYVKAAQDVRKLPEVTEHDYELRILAIPGLLTECFWLKWLPENPDRDLIVPFATAQKELMPLHPYSAGDFLKIVGPLAKRRLAAFQDLDDEQAGKALEEYETAEKKRAAWREMAARARR
jgi:hypothetical protein